MLIVSIIITVFKKLSLMVHLSVNESVHGFYLSYCRLKTSGL